MKFKKGHIPWNKKKKCPHMMGENNYFFGKSFKGEKSPNWKGGEIECVCQNCKKTFKVKKYRKNKANYCSYKCYWKMLKGRKLTKEHVGKIIFANIREKSCSWKGGRIYNGFGYIKIYCPEHPFATNHYVLEHRLVIEKQIGRYLTSKEVGHHIGEKDDNRPHMLMAFVSNGAHIRFHSKPNKVKPEEIVFDGRLLK